MSDHGQGVRVVDLAEAELDAVAALMTRVFGGRGDERELVAAWVREPDRCVRVALADGAPVGMAVATYHARFDPVAYSRDFACDLAAFLADAPTVVLNQILVEPAWRRRGVASALAAALRPWVRASGARSAIGVRWIHGGDHHSGHLFEAAGFYQLGRCEGFYRQFHEVSGQRCTVCTGPRCECAALLYGMRL